MYPIVESICIVNKQFRHIELHNQRFIEACRTHFGKDAGKTPENIIQIPQNIDNKRHKCRLTYDGNHFDYSIEPYIQRKIESLRIVHSNSIEYSIKTTMRNQLDKLFMQREGCDDIIIIKNGFVSDAWAANLILFDGEKWVTPSTPLLKGIQRQYLLNSNKIFEHLISENDLKKFKKIKLINAMTDFAHAPVIEVDTGLFE
ncbi:MAG: aminotransferase class IV [Prolixibacteraceae bacterium]|nr:aminotransferase class IV [Prolixibacteraceae bacterium]MBN2650109.1 aminotransferase class IV [Prolixibacteraceae bacterium]